MQKAEFIKELRADLKAGNKYNKTKLQAKAQQYGFDDPNDAKELAELAIVLEAREITQRQDLSPQHKYIKLVDLYEKQQNLSHRTSQSVLLQQYSTPAPISFLISEFVRSGNPSGNFFEPSAGNGLLTIAIDPKQVTVNEIDRMRRANLMDQPYAEVLWRDASERFVDFQRKFDGVMTNPPFGRLGSAVNIQEAKVKELDHLMAWRALECMADQGRAAIIIGGHTTWDDEGRITSGKNRIFYSLLHKYYNVVDSILINGKYLYTKQGTGFDTRIILIDGRKQVPVGFPPLFNEQKDTPYQDFMELYDRFSPHFKTSSDLMNKKKLLALRAKAIKLKLQLMDKGSLEGPYIPGSDAKSLNVLTPDSMDQEIHNAVARVKQDVGDIDEYVLDRLGYLDTDELYQALAAEQIDAVALAIYNIEEKGQGIIIGDQTGIGKGRQAAAMVRYGVQQGLFPIFITEKPNLFSDLYRDLKDIGSSDLVPFIVNARGKKTNIIDGDKIIHKAPEKAVQLTIIEDIANGEPVADVLRKHEYKFFIATYTQFASSKPTAKTTFLKNAAKDSILILDESHNASGSSSTGDVLRAAVNRSKGVTFLSATYAKRPDNMPLYASKTAIQDANMSHDALTEAIVKGGVALQEVISSQLVYEGQMIRRERSMADIKPNWLVLEDKAIEHKAIYDSLSEILRDIIGFQNEHVMPYIQSVDEEVKEELAEALKTEGTSDLGASSTPFFSRMFQMVNQILFALKAEAVAERAIMYLKASPQIKPVIAFENTMGSTLESITDFEGNAIGEGSTITTSFSYVLSKALDTVRKYSIKDAFGNSTTELIELHELGQQAIDDYYLILEKIDAISADLNLSPIDVVRQRIVNAGFKVGEVTGRKYQLRLDLKRGTGIVERRIDENRSTTFRKFNENELDVLMINQSGSTGASAHAKPNMKVPANEVKQRAMIVLQPSLDINKEVQKWGRINRTGQIMPPIYDYMVTAVPAEQRLMMMLQRKLKSLDANTSSNQKNSSTMLDVPDFLNKYGDKEVASFLLENPEINHALNDALSVDENGKYEVSEGFAGKVSGRVAVLSVKDQERFYNTVLANYQRKERQLRQSGDWDLEMEVLALEAELLDRKLKKVGRTANSVFGNATYLDKYRVKVLKKPYKQAEVEAIIAQYLEGKSTAEYRKNLIDPVKAFYQERINIDLAKIEEEKERLLNSITDHRDFKKLIDSDAKLDWISERKAIIEAGIAKKRQRALERSEGRRDTIVEFFEFFYPGRPIMFVDPAYPDGSVKVPGRFLGFKINENADNPYIPSAIEASFALTNSRKHIDLTLSGDTGNVIRSIIGSSVYMAAPMMEAVVSKWDELCRASSADTEIRYILTGNILQAFGVQTTMKGKLVSFTMKDGTVKKGLLLPQNFEPEASISSDKISAPLITCEKVVMSLSVGNSLETDNGIGLIRQQNDFKMMVPASKAKGGKFYLDELVLALVEGRNFHKIGDKMVGHVSISKMSEMIKVLDKQFSPSLNLSQDQFKLIQDQISTERKEETPVINLELEKKKKMLKLKAKAVALKLKLLSFAA